MIVEVHKSWKEGARRPCIVLPCGGGKSIIAADMAKRATDRGKRVLFLVHRQELCQQIEQTFLQYGVNMERCQVGMVQTVTRRLKRTPEPSLIITDENHHCLAGSYRRIYEVFPEVYCVGVTATPVRLNGGGLGEVNDKLIIGPSVKDLIAWNCLAPFNYYAPAVADLSGIHSRAGEFVADEVEAALDKPHVYGDVIRHYRELADGRKAMCYCPSIRVSQETARQFQEAGIAAKHIDGSTPKQERQQAVEAFRSGETRILCNVDLISEGFNVPDCGVSILLRPTKSLTLYIQQAMRCMRYQPDKRAVIIDHVGNVHRFGLPDADRKWTLDPKPPVKGKKPEVSVRQCQNCYYTYDPNEVDKPSVCPACGEENKRERKPPKEVKEAKLQKITEKVLKYRSPEECGSVQELYAYGKKMGYKPGWGYYQAKQRGFLR